MRRRGASLFPIDLIVGAAFLIAAAPAAADDSRARVLLTTSTPPSCGCSATTEHSQR